MAKISGRWLLQDICTYIIFTAIINVHSTYGSCFSFACQCLLLAGKPSVNFRLSCSLRSAWAPKHRPLFFTELFVKNLIELGRAAGGDLPRKSAWAVLVDAAPHSHGASHLDLNTSVCLEYKQGIPRAVCPCSCRHVFRSLSLFVRAVPLFIWGQRWIVAAAHVRTLIGICIHIYIGRQSLQSLYWIKNCYPSVA